ncbi:MULTISPECIES: copper resistance protein NlpE [unclassified Photobacterium]|uniref:copper resistance protein NlpE n=1 Tax=unclassified Photobacterium TaxID=2628852 RepID=UPI001EDD0738|nr:MULTISPECIES: copper resistance protein NlpE [unclassified Photobacterium]MCG3863965.1 copper resistance protein NlpE N-terminal domain-containing protein [Photobacterium sp. Ph6]MCG3875507.1 copper resistance protein NlpE N-terminal domain-containing protein [Photobacterium sp. Ph5]
MKKTILATVLLGLVLVGCDQASDKTSSTVPAANGQVTELSKADDNAKNSLDWMGEYTGIEPCADCSGIETSLTLKDDGTYILDQTYQGKETKPLTTEGKFNWNDEGDTITLNLGGGQSTQYFVSEQRIFHLDKDGKRVQGDLADAYTLKKQDHK